MKNRSLIAPKNHCRLPCSVWMIGFWLSALPVMAQAPSASVVPNAQELLSPEIPEAVPTEASPAEAVPQSIDAIPEPVVQPEDAKSVDLELSSPSGSAEANPSLVSPNLVEQVRSSFGQSNSASNNLIDSTPYTLGATDNPSVVLSERSTGCETVVQPGQSVPSSLCDGNASTWSAESSGVEVTSGSDMNLGVVYGGRVTPSGKDFYNLTIRPAAKISSAAINFLFPLSIPAAITSAFGWRVHPVLGESRFHAGTDLGSPQGTPVLAAFAGKVAPWLTLSADMVWLLCFGTRMALKRAYMAICPKFLLTQEKR